MSDKAVRVLVAVKDWDGFYGVDFKYDGDEVTAATVTRFREEAIEDALLHIAVALFDAALAVQKLRKTL